jgi:iron-sulfur cluster assembly 2
MFRCTLSSLMRQGPFARMRPTLYKSVEAGTTSVVITPECVSHLQKLVSPTKNSDSTEAVGLRISVEPGGCYGYSYRFTVESLADIDSAADIVIERDGGFVVVDKEVSWDLIKGSTIGYENEMMRAGFVVLNNPHSQSACGCGISVSF